MPSSTWMLNVLIEFPRVRNLKGVHPADIYPQLKVDSDEVVKANWIWNTDTSDKPGTRWILCSYTQHALSEVGRHEVSSRVHDCEIFDSWGLLYGFDVVLDIITKKFEEALHVKRVGEKVEASCVCRLEVKSPIKRIQHLSYNACRWWCLYFVTFKREELEEWMKVRVKYGPIHDNEDLVYEYFDKIFFSPTGDKNDCDKHFNNYFKMRNYCIDCCKGSKMINQLCCCPSKSEFGC